MKLRTLTVVAVGVLALSLTACQKKEEAAAPAADAAPAAEAAPAAPAAEAAPAAPAAEAAPPADAGAMATTPEKK